MSSLADSRIYRTAADAATVDEAPARIAEALARLEEAASHTFRRTPTGELIESIGCILTGRKGSWWPSTSSPQPGSVNR